MKQGISKMVGQALDASGESLPLFCALRPLSCATCGTAIGQGELFTRHALSDPELLIFAHCRKCTPFTSQSSRRSRSDLIESLLTAPDNDEPPAAKSQPGLVAEAVEKRLGPALEYARRARSRREK